MQQNLYKKFGYVFRVAMLKKIHAKKAPDFRMSICFFSSAKRELSPATLSSLHKGGFCNCEGFKHHAITKDKSLLPLSFLLFL